MEVACHRGRERPGVYLGLVRAGRLLHETEYHQPYAKQQGENALHGRTETPLPSQVEAWHNPQEAQRAPNDRQSTND
jgi:hypothetical protein